MKKLSLLLGILLAGTCLAQEDQSWRIGAQWGFQGNHSRLTGGMEEADARFSHNKAGGAALNVLVRYDHNKHFMLTGGLGFQSFGFEFGLAENYSLLNPAKRFAGVKSEFSALEMPVMVHYKFNPNCRNARWLIGAGWVQGLLGTQVVNSSYTPGGEANSSGNFLSCSANAGGDYYTMARFSVGREKMYKRGSILNASLVFNAGLKQLATAHVTYRVDGKVYEHDFSNNGNYVGFRLTYFFRPLKAFKP